MGAMSQHPPETLDPSDWSATRAQAHRMLDDVLDYVENIRQRPLWQPVPPALREHFSADLPQAPQDLAEVHHEFMQFILPFASGNVHPGFMGWVQGGGNVAGMLGEMLAGGLNANVGGRDHAAIYVERQITRWLREIFGFPKEASGLFVTGTSMANFLAVLVARRHVLGPQVRHQGIGCGDRRLRAYTSAAAHGCIPQAFDMGGFGTDSLRRIPTDARQQIDLDALCEAVRADREAGGHPFLIVGTAGTVDVGAVDNLEALAELAAAEGLWFHVDGAYGALAMLAPSLAPRFRGIERADSIALDFHKWGQVPYDAGFLLVRDGARHAQTFASSADYLRRETRGLGGGAPWPCDFGPDLSRGFRALKTWFTLKVYGTRHIGAVIERLCELAQTLKRRVEDAPELELLAPVNLNIVCFRYRSDSLDADALNREIVIALHEGGEVAPSTTVIDGHLAIRAALVNHRTLEEDVQKLVDRVRDVGGQITASARALK